MMFLTFVVWAQTLRMNKSGQQKSIEVLCDVKNADIKRDQQDENLGF